MNTKLTERRRFSRDEKMKVLAKTACKCGHCGKALEPHEATLDHIIPLNKGGLNDEFNLVGLCLECNERKSNFVYDITDYYNHILPEYIPLYMNYHDFAAYDLRQKSLFGYNAKTYMMYPDKQKQIIVNMIKRGTKKKKVLDIMNKMGVPLFLTRAYEGDAEEIMELINHCIKNERIVVKNSYYTNDYMVADDIRHGEVYILRAKTSNKICGAFIFKKIDDESLPIVQLQNIIMETTLHAKYIMMGAFVDNFAHDVFNDVMEDIASNMLYQRAIPIYFDILKNSFVDANECIIMPYNLDGVDGSLEFMPLKYIRKMAKETAADAAEETDENLDDDELDLLTEMIINHREHSEIDEEDENIKALFENHPSLKRMFKPDDCPLYAVGFLKRKEDEKHGKQFLY